MCNAYRITRKDKAGLELAKALENLKSSLIRPTLSGVVMVNKAPEIMRWGFSRPFNKSVNNTRSDKLESPMWKKAFLERRCLIPVSGFYEWSGAKGHKRTHYFTAPDDGYLWMAGIGEENEELGRCYSMLTTEANSLVKPIHNRMPVVLTPSQHEPYLAGEIDTFKPAPELLKVEDAANPLTKKPEQRELF